MSWIAQTRPRPLDGRRRGGQRAHVRKRTVGFPARLLRWQSVESVRLLRGVPGLLNEAAILLLLVWLLPLAILAVGVPVALFVRLLMAIVNLL